MDLKILLQQYVNLLVVYQYVIEKGKNTPEFSDVNLLFQEKNLAYERFIDRIFRASTEELIELRDYIDICIQELDTNDLIVYKHLDMKKYYYININVALNNIIAERKNKTYRR